jgi:outer membrane protein assembly factor BamA
MKPYTVLAQTNANINLQIIFSTPPSNDFISSNGIVTNFISIKSAETYVNKLPEYLFNKGFPGASVDSVIKTDSSIVVFLFTGPSCKIVSLNMPAAQKEWAQGTGLYFKKNTELDIEFYQFLKLRDKIINYYENNGYPFTTVTLDSAKWENNKLTALLNVDKGVYYMIDSISVSGNIAVKNEFLQRYLSISNKSGFNKYLLSQVDKKISDLNFLTQLQPSTVTMLGTGAILNLYLKSKKTNQINFLVGLMPASQNAQKTLLTGDVNLDIKNALKSGERIVFKWQQLQPKSPRLNLGFNRPYILNSPFGLDFIFEMFKKDSNFLQINSRLGCQFEMQSGQIGKVFFQWQQNTLLPGAIDTIFIKSQKELPVNSDIQTSSIGFSYILNKTNYRLNPKRGSELECTGIAGLKRIKKSDEIVSLSEPGFNYASLYDSIRLNTYLVKCKINAAHYFDLGKSATLKTSINSGLYFSPDIFRNDLFQIGGSTLLRGFDEESIYASKYVVFSAEYRLLFGVNSFISFFSDFAKTDFQFQQFKQNNNYLGAGLGIQYETKTGLLNVSYAAGKTIGMPFNITQSSKIHFGYVNYF